VAERDPQPDPPRSPEPGRSAREDAPPPDGAEAAQAETSPPRADPLSAMTRRFNLIFRFFASRFFRHFDLDDATVARLRELESRGAVVYVMRYASRLDYFLFNVLFLREGLRLSGFANGIRFWYYQPLRDALRTLWTRPRGVSQDIELVRAREYCRELSREGGSLFLFLRTANLRAQLRSRKGRLEQSRQERDLLTEVVAAAQATGRPVHVVPLALFWRKGPRARRRFLNLSYGALTRPNDASKVLSFLTTYRGLHVKVGDAIDLQGFAAVRPETTAVALARVVRRTVLSFLYREERLVEGPVLQPLYRVQEIVVSSSEVQAAIAEHAEEKRVSPERARVQAEKHFREIAANMNSTFLAVLDMLVGAIIDRLFGAVEHRGIEGVAEVARRDPVVLVPTHRSYFDFLIISVLFYRQHLVPPHIAARENMAFGPFGFVWRRAGAFFLRRSFDDPLYKSVFRNYVSYLIKEGFTQEFFIEGGRSRTGKTLAPRLGMLSWDVEAFLHSGRRDLLFVPVALTYERLVEEGAMVGELEGGAKQEESMLGLVRARKFLQRRFGSVFVHFGEPLSLVAAMGEDRPRLVGDDEEAANERRRFVERFGNLIVERMNWAIVPHATSVAACALLAETRRGMFRTDLVRRMQQLVDLLRMIGVELTPALLRDEGDFSESIASLLRMDLVKVSDDPRGEILYYEPGKRRALDIYRNTLLHYLAAPSFLAHELLVGGERQAVLDRQNEWLDLFYGEFFTPRGEVRAAHRETFLLHFTRLRWVEESDGVLRATSEGRRHLAFIAEQTEPVLEGYAAAAAAVAHAELPVRRRALQKAVTQHFERAALLGETGLPEASNPVTFGNAVHLMLRLGVLERVPDDEGKDPSYQRGPNWAELPGLRERLAPVRDAR